jgi:hypothetical protein
VFRYTLNNAYSVHCRASSYTTFFCQTFLKINLRRISLLSQFINYHHLRRNHIVIIIIIIIITNYVTIRSRVSAVGIATSTFRGLNPARDRDVFLLQHFIPALGPPPANYSVCTWVISLGLSDRAWSKLLTSVWCQGGEWVELYLFPAHAVTAWTGTKPHYVTMYRDNITILCNHVQGQYHHTM